MRNHCPYALLLWLAFTATAWSQVTPIGPFTGTYMENFDNLPGVTGGSARQQVDIFQDFCLVRNLTSGGALKFEFSSSLGGDLVLPRSPPIEMGALGISDWTFDAPVSKFGGYWENNSRFDDAVVDFFDVNNVLVATKTATTPHLLQAWTWNGWESTVPISRLVVTGNDVEFLNGFIWFDDMQVTPASSAVPEPATVTLLLGAACAASVGVYVRSQRRRANAHPLEEIV